MGLVQRFKKILMSRGRPEKVESLSTAPTWVSRAPRIRVLPLHRVSFQRESPVGTFKVSNLSATGLGLVAEPGIVWPALGEMISGDLVVGEGSKGSRISLRARIVRLSDTVVGVHFMEKPPGLIEALRGYFKVESAALKLTAVKSELLEANTEGKPFCFVGENNTQLFYTEKQGELTSFELSLFGNHIEAFKGRSLKFGSLSHDEVADKPKFKGATLVFPASQFTEELNSEAVRFVENIELIDARIRRLITAAIVSGKLD
jgi:hypothetical protein